MINLEESLKNNGAIITRFNGYSIAIKNDPSLYKRLEEIVVGFSLCKKDKGEIVIPLLKKTEKKTGSFHQALRENEIPLINISW